MTEHPESFEAQEAEPVRTGVEHVDAVIAAVEELDERPLEDHVRVFESAHEGLRRALDSQPGPGGQPGRPS